MFEPLPDVGERLDQLPLIDVMQLPPQLGVLRFEVLACQHPDPEFDRSHGLGGDIGGKSPAVLHCKGPGDDLAVRAGPVNQRRDAAVQ